MSEDKLSLRTEIIVSDGDTFETIACQLQKKTDRILCVVDGSVITWYADCRELPKGLLFEHKIKRVFSEQVHWEYYYRSAIDDSLYAFFQESIHNLLRSQEDAFYTGRVVNLQRLQVDGEH